MNILKKWWFWILLLVIIGMIVGFITIDFPTQAVVSGGSSSISGGGAV